MGYRIYLQEGQHAAQGRFLLVLVGLENWKSAGLGDGMNNKDRLYVIRELNAWSNWVRQGRTFPNILGYKGSTVEYSLMRGETGGDYQSTSKVPGRFNLDRNVECIDKVFWRFPIDIRDPITAIYLYRLSERRTASILDISRRQIGNRLNSGYLQVYDALRTTDKKSGI